MNRRTLLKTLATGGSLAALPSVAQAAASAYNCRIQTPAQTEGPFYPVRDQLDKDVDLTTVRGSPLKASGRVILVKGLVLDQACRPIADAVVEIWQACASGRYNHPGDPNKTAPLDPNFQYWGIAKTNSRGEYTFRTIYPGAYPANPTWMRPPHIHFKAYKWGFNELITQLYFDGEKHNARDLILQAIKKPEQVLVVRPVVNDVVRFDLTLHKY